MTITQLFRNDYDIFGRKFRVSCSAVKSKGYPEFD